MHYFHVYLGFLLATFDYKISAQDDITIEVSRSFREKSLRI